MLTQFQKHVIEEIEEIGEYALVWLIPRYLLIVKKQKIIEPIDKNPENYNIDVNDFEDLIQQILELITNYDFKLYLFVSNPNSTKWEENFLLQPNVESLLNKREVWFEGKEQALFISR